jgi:hypothetical protein
MPKPNVTCDIRLAKLERFARLGRGRPTRSPTPANEHVARHHIKNKNQKFFRKFSMSHISEPEAVEIAEVTEPEFSWPPPIQEHCIWQLDRYFWIDPGKHCGRRPGPQVFVRLFRCMHCRRPQRVFDGEPVNKLCRAWEIAQQK